MHDKIIAKQKLCESSWLITEIINYKLLWITMSGLLSGDTHISRFTKYTLKYTGYFSLEKP